MTNPLDQTSNKTSIERAAGDARPLKWSWVVHALAVATALALTGCSALGDPCDGVAEGSCLPLSAFELGPTTASGSNPITFRLEFVNGDQTLVLSCVAEQPEDCETAFSMPDLARLPHGEATLLTENASTQSLRGSFRLTEVSLLTDDRSYRVSGRVDRLYFDTPTGELQITEAEFDVVAAPPVN